MRKTKIICTIGPATDNYDSLRNLMLAGMNGARINFSHGSWKDQLEKVNLVKKVREELRLPVSLILDTKGPEIRLGKFKEKTLLEEGNKFILTTKDVIGDNTIASVSYTDLYKEVKVGSNILLDDGLIKLEVMQISDNDIVCEVKNTEYINSNKSVNVPNVKLNLPSLTEKDIADIEGAITNKMDYIAASFVRRKEDVLAIRKILDAHNSKIGIISKIENREGVDNFDEILELSDGIMIARGDLGVEIPFYEVPIIQKDMIKKTFAAGKIVITATQMMDSMIVNPNPTRAEVSDVANAIFDGTSAIMLSGETATGKYPIECVKKMNEIAINVEASMDYDKRFLQRAHIFKNFEYIINHSLVTTGIATNAKAICSYTYTGDTPRIVASFLPKQPIYVTTSNIEVYYQLGLCWGIDIFYDKIERKAKDMILSNIERLVDEKILKKDDIILIAGGKYIRGDERDMNKSIGGIYQI